MCFLEKNRSFSLWRSSCGAAAPGGGGLKRKTSLLSLVSRILWVSFLSRIVFSKAEPDGLLAHRGRGGRGRLQVDARKDARQDARPDRKHLASEPVVCFVELFQRTTRRSTPGIRFFSSNQVLEVEATSQIGRSVWEPLTSGPRGVDQWKRGPNSELSGATYPVWSLHLSPTPTSTTPRIS